MIPEAALSTLVRQVSLARAELLRRTGTQEDATLARAVAESVRRTLALALAGRDPRTVTPEAGHLELGPAGEIHLTSRGVPVPVPGPIVRAAFRAAGVGLEPGQALLLEETLLGRLVEAALGALVGEEARIRSRKARLIRAALTLGDAFPPAPPDLGPGGREAA